VLGRHLCEVADAVIEAKKLIPIKGRHQLVGAEDNLMLYALSKSGSKSSKLEKRHGARWRKKSTSSRSLAAQYAQTSPTLSLW
jgi:hypothetical protein